MRIFSAERDTTACNFYRILSPLYKLDEKDMAQISIVKEHQLGDDNAINLALASDILVFQRPATESWFKFIKTCQKHGKLMVSDYDDDPFNTSPLNPFYQYTGVEEYQWKWADGTTEWLWSEDMVGQAGNKIFNIERNINHRDMFRLNFKKSDLVTCTTEILRQEFLKINPSVAVLPNCIDINFFPKRPNFIKKEIRIGWQGGASHYEDLYLIKDAITNILKKHDNVKFIYFGDMRFQGLFKDAPQAQIEWHSWVSHATYPYKLSLLNLDIGLCPLVDNVFNKNKSSIKWMEYSMVGAATIASDIAPYSITCNNGIDAMLVNEFTWEDAMDNLIRDKQKRDYIASNAFENVYQNHNIDTKVHLWYEAYSKLLKPEAVGV